MPALTAILSNSTFRRPRAGQRSRARRMRPPRAARRARRRDCRPTARAAPRSARASIGGHGAGLALPCERERLARRPRPPLARRLPRGAERCGACRLRGCRSRRRAARLGGAARQISGHRARRIGRRGRAHVREHAGRTERRQLAVERHGLAALDLHIAGVGQVARREHDPQSAVAVCGVDTLRRKAAARVAANVHLE